MLRITNHVSQKHLTKKRMLPLLKETASIVINFNQRLIKELLRNFLLLVLQDDEVDSLRQALI